jgi:hypothetical protein
MLIERAIKNVGGRLNTACARIPFGDDPFGEANFDRDSLLPRVIKIENRRFHAYGAAKAKLEASIAKMLDETREVRGPGKW